MRNCRVLLTHSMVDELVARLSTNQYLVGGAQANRNRAIVGRLRDGARDGFKYKYEKPPWAAGYTAQMETPATAPAAPKGLTWTEHRDGEVITVYAGWHHSRLAAVVELSDIGRKPRAAATGRYTPLAGSRQECWEGVYMERFLGKWDNPDDAKAAVDVAFETALENKMIEPRR